MINFTYYSKIALFSLTIIILLSVIVWLYASRKKVFNNTNRDAPSSSKLALVAITILISTIGITYLILRIDTIDATDFILVASNILLAVGGNRMVSKYEPSRQEQTYYPPFGQSIPEPEPSPISFDLTNRNEH